MVIDSTVQVVLGSFRSAAGGSYSAGNFRLLSEGLCLAVIGFGEGWHLRKGRMRRNSEVEAVGVGFRMMGSAAAMRVCPQYTLRRGRPLLVVDEF
jgi:hypothetical protein